MTLHKIQIRLRRRKQEIGHRCNTIEQYFSM